VILLQAVSRMFNFLPDEQRQQSWRACVGGLMIRNWPKRPRIRLNEEAYALLRRKILERDDWRCQGCGSSVHLQIHHKEFRSQSGHDAKENLITLCAQCHMQIHMTLKSDETLLSTTTGWE
jgi:5-methylcytosine-specific restriction endonuclease McrA